ncbi:MAG: hypothetical protein H5T96_04010 [Tissierellales bacterium]|nr:hypothetical protein [Tissierellales bacterium]
MILSIELQPTYQKNMILEKVGSHEFNIIRTYDSAQGKGIDFINICNILGQDSKLLTFIGSNNTSKIYFEKINTVGIDIITVDIKDSVNENLILNYPDRYEILKDNKMRLTSEEVNRFLKVMTDIILDNNIVFLSFDHHSIIEDEALKLIINNFFKHNIKVLIPINSFNYKHAMEMKLDSCTIDVETLEEILHIKLYSDKDIIKAANYLLEKNISRLVVVEEEGKYLAVTDDKVFNIEIKINKEIKLNQGYLMAGIANSINRGYDIEMMIRLAFACGLLDRDNFKEIGLTEIKENMNIINITSYNNLG